VRLLRRLTGGGESSAASSMDEELLRQLEAVSHVSGREALELALGALMQMIDAQRGFIAVRDEDGTLQVVVARAFASLEMAQPEAQLSRSILDRALEDAGMLNIDDAGTDDRFATAGSVQVLRLKAVLAVPLVHDGTPFGVLYLDNPTTASAFDEGRRASAGHLAEIVAPVVAREIELSRLRNTVQASVEQLRQDHGFEAIIGRSERMLEVLRLVAKVAPTRATVLVVGETGTGKELVAQAIHAESKRAAGPFVAINCAALPKELVEAELFGHERGAFTGAERRRVGRFEAASGGTLFLDEVGDLPPDAQAKMLRVLEEGRFERVGSSESTAVDVRVVCATHRDLKALVAQGRFREDLLFRIRVLEVDLPPLRERDEDVLHISEALLQRYAADHGSLARELSPAAKLALQTYPWPGNVRELRNVIERATILATEAVIELDLLPPEIAGATGAAAPLDIKAATREFKRRFVRQARAAANGDHAKTAELLGVNAKYLYQLLKDLDLVES